MGENIKKNEDIHLPQLLVSDMLTELRRRFIREYVMTDDIPGITSKLVEEIRRGEGLARKWGAIEKETLIPILKGFEIGGRDENIVYSSSIDLSSGGIENKL
jgi:hypothetical protein